MDSPETVLYVPVAQLAQLEVIAVPVLYAPVVQGEHTDTPVSEL